MKSAIFIDYDNLLQSQKTQGILDIVTSVMLQMSWNSDAIRGRCEIRIYGGWFENATMTTKAQEIDVAVKKLFPCIIKLPGTKNQVIATAELAFALLEDPSRHLFNTFRKKYRYPNLRVKKPTEAGCHDVSCLLPLLQKLVQKGRCPKHGCQVQANDLVFRHEQKIVDTMLACDLLYATGLGYDKMALVSDDDDFFPPILTAALRGISIEWFHPKPNGQRAPISVGHVHLIEKDL